MEYLAQKPQVNGIAGFLVLKALNKLIDRVICIIFLKMKEYKNLFRHYK